MVNIHQLSVKQIAIAVAATLIVALGGLVVRNHKATGHFYKFTKPTTVVVTSEVKTKAKPTATDPTATAADPTATAAVKAKGKAAATEAAAKVRQAE